MAKKKKKNTESHLGASLITLSKPTSVIAEQFRILRTNIQFSMVDQDLKTMVVTSPGAGEGKSTVSANIAVSFATQGKRVLLVDCDMRKPTVHKTFKVANNEGLTTLLTGKEVSLSKTLDRSPESNLYLLTSGPIPPNPSELLSSKKMNQIIEALTSAFDLVIFDMPPIVSVTDAQIMASKVDGAVLVVRQGVSNKAATAKAKELLDVVKANVIGVVLNGIAREKSNNAGYYGYGMED